MNVNEDLVGKTITGVIATQSAINGLREIWMLQFADGTHVEFVSPGARKALRNAAKGSKSGRTNNAKISNFSSSSSLGGVVSNRQDVGAQLCLNVA